MRRFITTTTVLLALLLVGGCGGGIFNEPEVTLRNVEIAGLGLRGGTLLVNLEITNPNRFDLDARQLEYQVSIAETQTANDTTWLDLADGVYQEPFSVAAGATETFQLPIEFTYSGLGGAAASILRAGTVTYRANGTVHVRTPIGSRAVPFRRSGMVSLLRGAN